MIVRTGVYYNDFRATNVELIAQLDVLTATRRWNSSSGIHRRLSAAVRATPFFHPELQSLCDFPATSKITDALVFDGFFYLNAMIKL